MTDVYKFDTIAAALGAELISGSPNYYLLRVKLAMGANDADSGDVSPSNGIPILDGYVTASTTTVTTATAVGQLIASSCLGMDTIGVTIQNSGTITGGAIVFEANDGANWFAIKGAQLNAYAGNSVWSFTSGSQAWQFSVSGFQQFRVRLTSQLTGSNTPQVIITHNVSSAPDVSQVTVGLDNGVTNYVSLAPATSGGLTPYSSLTSSGVLAVNIKATPGNIYGVEISNSGAAAIYARLYDKATAPGTGDTPIQRLFIPAGGNVITDWPNGVSTVNGIGIRVTGASADNDNTAPTATVSLVNVYYK